MISIDSFLNEKTKRWVHNRRLTADSLSPSVFNSQVTKAWGYFLWGGNSIYITSSGPESSPKIAFTVTSGAWYKLKTEVNGTNVKIYVDDKLAKEITMSGSGADAKSNNYVGIWCHSSIPIKGDSFQGKRNKNSITFIGVKRVSKGKSTL